MASRPSRHTAPALLNMPHESNFPASHQGQLARWLEEIPLYRDRLLNRASLSAAGPVDFAGLPLITKADIRRGFPANFLREGASLDDLLDRELVELEHTSGTSEERTPLLLGRGWWAEQEARALRLNARVAAVLDSTPGRRVTLSSPVCNGDVDYRGVPTTSQRTVGQTLYAGLSRQPFLWGEAELARIAREALAWQPQFLDVDPVYGVVFALHCERLGIRFPTLQFILASYEFVSAAHRRVLERVFGVPVFNLYGSTETGHLLMENERGEMLPSAQTAWFEVLHRDSSGLGELIVTTLTNEFMPLIRYRIGDLVERREEQGKVVFVVHGRAMDAVRRPDGGRVTVWEVDQRVSDVEGIAHYQLRAEPGGGWLLRYVPDNLPPRGASLVALRQDLDALLGSGGRLRLEASDAVLPESSGKFRLVYPPAA